MFDPAERIKNAQIRLYWKRHAFSTLMVVTVASLISLLLYPAGLPLFLASGVGGFLLYWGASRHTWWGSGIAVVGVLLPCAGAWLFVPSRELMWTQGIAPFFVGMWGLSLWLTPSEDRELDRVLRRPAPESAPTPQARKQKGRPQAPGYSWSCASCHAANSKDVGLCTKCSFPAFFDGRTLGKSND